MGPNAYFLSNTRIRVSSIRLQLADGVTIGLAVNTFGVRTHQAFAPRRSCFPCPHFRLHERCGFSTSQGFPRVQGKPTCRPWAW